MEAKTTDCGVLVRRTLGVACGGIFLAVTVMLCGGTSGLKESVAVSTRDAWVWCPPGSMEQKAHGDGWGFVACVRGSDGVRDGPYREFYVEISPKGKVSSPIRAEGYYSDGLMDGVWVYWDPGARRRCVEEWDTGRRLRAIHYGTLKAGTCAGQRVEGKR